MRKTVCVVGAGPAGLVAAKTFLQTGHFDVTVYEQRDRVGGIWAIDEETKDGFLDARTPTNLSRFTVAFSDLDWNAVDLGGRSEGGGAGERSAAPVFPRAWMVGRYLEEYARRFVPGEVVLGGREVVAAVAIEGGAGGWEVETTRVAGGKAHRRRFDYLVMASGFFSRPRPLKGQVARLGAPDIAQIHSSRFKTLQDLFPHGPGTAQGKSILVIGGGNSGAETSAAIAKHLSDIHYSPATARRDLYAGTNVVNVFPRQVYSLPPFVESAEHSNSYVPIDFRLYDYGKRTPWPPESYAGFQKPEARKLSHAVLQGLVGDQRDLGCEAMVVGEGEERVAAGYAALSESYAEFVRSGVVRAVRGRVVGIDDGSNGTGIAGVETGNGEGYTLEDIGAIVYATGYTPSPALDFLDSDTKAKLHYDPESPRLPIILEQYQTANLAVPNLAFLGCYEGPYWPIIELQAHLTVHRWLYDTNAPRKPYEEPEELLQLRQRMKGKDSGVGQFWFADYMGYFEDTARFLKLRRNDAPFGSEREGPAHPSRYLSPYSDVGVNERIVEDLHATWLACVHEGRYVAHAVFRALQGDWRLTRQIGNPGASELGEVSGTAAFHPRFPTHPGYDFEYMYVEKDTCAPLSPSSPFTSTRVVRRYVYRYSEARDEMSVWFVKGSDGLEVDGLSHTLSFVKPEEARKEGALVASGGCKGGREGWRVRYRFEMERVRLKRWEVRCEVQRAGTEEVEVGVTRYGRARHSQLC